MNLPQWSGSNPGGGSFGPTSKARAGFGNDVNRRPRDVDPRPGHLLDLPGASDRHPGGDEVDTASARRVPDSRRTSGLSGRRGSLARSAFGRRATVLLLQACITCSLPSLIFMKSPASVGSAWISSNCFAATSSGGQHLFPPIPIIGLANSALEVGPVTPTERIQLGNVEKLAGGPVGL